MITRIYYTKKPNIGQLMVIAQGKNDVNTLTEFIKIIEIIGYRGIVDSIKEQKENNK